MFLRIPCSQCRLPTNKDGMEKNEWGKCRFNISKAGNLRAFSQCRLPPFKNTVFVPIQSVLTKKPGDYRLRYIKTILSFQNSVQLPPCLTGGCFFKRVISICHISLKSPFYADFNDTNLKVFFDTSQISQSKLSIPKILESHWLIWEASKKTLRLVSLKSA